MEKELSLLLPLLEGEVRQARSNGFLFHTGQLAGHDIVACQCGIGKVNAAIGTLTLLDVYAPDLVINTGVAGGADPEMHVLDLLVADGVAYHDVWCGPGTVYGTAYGFPTVFSPSEKVLKLAHEELKNDDKLRFGLICSGDKFITTEAEVKDIKARFPGALAVDMESGAIAQTCTLRQVPFAIIRVISDTPGQEENISQYENFWTDAPAETFTALVTLIKTLK